MYQKKKWAIQLAQKRLVRKRRRIEDAGDELVTGAVGRSGLSNRSLSSFMQHTANNILNTPWQVIQVCFSCSTKPNTLWSVSWLNKIVLMYDNIMCVTLARLNSEHESREVRWLKQIRYRGAAVLVFGLVFSTLIAQN